MTKTLIFLAVLAAIAAAAAWYKSPSLAWEGALSGGRMFLAIIPLMLVGILLGSMVQVLLPRELVAAYAGEESGLVGLLIATVAGAATPMGPFVAFPLVASLWKAGTGIGPLVAYLTSWALLGMNRVIIFELPILGWRFLLLRLLAVGAMPIVAGLLAGWVHRRLPLP